MDTFINLEILANPINWLIVVVILTLTFYGAYVIWSNATMQGPLAVQS